jgi:glucan 1,3-beta-glucosidase
MSDDFDQPWKRALEGTVGGHWGLFTATRQPKFPLTGPVSNLPHWPVMFVAGSVLAALPLLWAMLRRRTLGAGGWIALAAGAQAAGSVLLLQAGQAILASRTTVDGLVAAAGLAVTAAIAWLLLDALGRGDAGAARTAPIRGVLAWLRRPLPAGATPAVILGALRLVATAAALAASLGLVFDPRYRDFPIAAFLVPAVGFILADVFGRAASERRGPPLGPEERWLAALLALAAIAIALREGLLNHQALSWAAVCLALALPWGVRWGTRALRPRS